MGGCFASMAACCACQAASCACSSALSCCGRAMSKSTATRAAYVGLFFITAFVAFIMMFWGGEILAWVPSMKICTPDDGSSSSSSAGSSWFPPFSSSSSSSGSTATNSMCFGVNAVYRLCFGLFMFHAIFALFLIRVRDSGDPRAGIQDGWWILKVLLWIGLIVIAFVIPNGFYRYYGYFAFVGAFFFIIVQLILLIDMAYTWTDSWVRNWQDRDDDRWYYALLASTGTLYAIAITGFVLLFVYFGSGDKSSLNLGITIFEIIMCLFLSYISVSPKVQEVVPNIGLLQSAVVTVYTCYLIGSAFLSEPCSETDSSKCSNPFAATDSGGQVASIVLGAVFTIAAVCYSTIRAAGSDALIRSSESETLLDKPDGGEAGGEEADDDKKEDDEVEGVAYNYSFFHLVFATAAMYICQLLTNWAIPNNVDDASTSGSTSVAYYVDSGMAAVWVKIASSWIALGLYGWTMVAPLMFPDRDWS